MCLNFGAAGSASVIKFETFLQIATDRLKQFNWMQWQQQRQQQQQQQCQQQQRWQLQRFCIRSKPRITSKSKYRLKLQAIIGNSFSWSSSLPIASTKLVRLTLTLDVKQECYPLCYPPHYVHSKLCGRYCGRVASVLAKRLWGAMVLVLEWDLGSACGTAVRSLANQFGGGEFKTGQLLFYSYFLSNFPP